jgi:hypothetical protein
VEEQLNFAEYQDFMVRLHRLILPEFNLKESKQLIKQDWDRDTDGADRLTFRFFHLSMFELADLWTDTIKLKDVSITIAFSWRKKTSGLRKTFACVCFRSILRCFTV